MNNDTVIYRKTVNGSEFAVTVGNIMQNDDILAVVLSHGVHRIANSARTNAEDKDAAEAHRLQQLVNGELWKQGGGNAVDDRTRLYREHLASWAQAHCQYKRTEAATKARKDDSALLAETAKAILRKKGDSTGKDRVQQAASNLHARIMKDVDAALDMSADI